VGIFDIFKKKGSRGHELTQEERDLGNQTKQQMADLKQLKHRNSLAEEQIRHEIEMIELQGKFEEAQQWLEDITGEDEEPEGDTPEALLMAFLAKTIMGKQNPNLTTNIPPLGSEGALSSNTDEAIPSDAELREMYQHLPDNYKKMAQNYVKK
jgi:hypothetical protein